MSSLSEKYAKILSDIDSHISKQEERQYVSKKIQELSSIYMELIDRVTKSSDSDKIEQLESKQEKMNLILSKVQDSVNLIKKDIYEEDSYDFEIVCPYCNHEFVADVESELREEIECPECHNMIQLDWDEDECNTCSGDCTSCGMEHNEPKKDDNENEDDM